ncbi:MAG: NPCBM/NEW2 domain-containing protein [Planctomycetes bacterium]|nr:NPCBM/NEW2 domain-containing protein [Planctomycetota bacterium]
MHGYSSLTYELKGEFERFSAVIGVDDSVGGSGSVVFRVLGDGKALFESRVMRGGDAPESVVVDLAGLDRLTLECDTADELDLSDHADWANAVLIRRKGAKK